MNITKSPRAHLPKERITLVVGNGDSKAMKLGFRHEQSALTYIAHRNIADLMVTEKIWLFDEFDDALDHMGEILRQDALRKLTIDERRALGIKD